MRLGRAAAAVVVVALCGARAGAQGVSTAEVRQAVFPRLHGADLGVRDEENRPLFLASFDWARWPKGPAGTYVALAVATTERGVGPGGGCDRQRAAVPGGVLLAVVRREKVRVKRRLVTKLRMVGHDSRLVTLGCADGVATESITLDAGGHRLSDAEQGVVVRRRTASATGRTEEVLLYRFTTEVRLVLETEVPVGEPKAAFEPARSKSKGFFDWVRRVAPRPLPRRAPPATQPVSPPATQPTWPEKTVFRWSGTRYVPGR